MASMKALMGIFKRRSGNRSRILGTQIPIIQGFGASNFHTYAP
jgi:hypothetical protein